MCLQIVVWMALGLAISMELNYDTLNLHYNAMQQR